MLKAEKIKIILFFLNTIYLFSFSQCGDTYYGEGTFYGYGGGGNCSFPTPEQPVLTGAMNELQYDTSAICGACVEVTGPEGSLEIRIEDRCPECAFGDIDLSEEAFPYIAEVEDGRVPISWKIVPCPVTGAVRFYFKEGSSRWWTAVQVRNHRYPIQTFEYKVDDAWVEVERMMYNYFLVESGMGTGPYDFRVTDIFGNVIEETRVEFADTTEIEGTQQFPECVDDGKKSQVLNLAEGWNAVTLNIEIESTVPDVIFPNADCIKNQEDSFIRDQADFLNTLSAILPGEPYLIHNTVSEQLTLTGEEYTADTTVSLKEGWNFIAYPNLSIKEISTVIEAVKDSVIEIKNIKGFWQPDVYDNTIKYFIPGNAYFIQTTGACIITL